jgi:hypothetical protein
MSGACVPYFIDANLRIKCCNASQWFTPDIPASWEAERGGLEFKVSLGKT